MQDSRRKEFSGFMSRLYRRMNVPVCETLEIIINKLFISMDTLYLGYFKKTVLWNVQFSCVTNTYFFFNNNLYKQKEGLTMGNPLGPGPYFS